MKEYDVKITETLEKTVTVQAESHDAAEEQVRAAYYNSEYILDSENFTGVAFGTTEEREVQKEQADTMNVLLVKPFMYPQAVQIGCELEDLQKAVGGDIEATYPFNEPVALVMHDEGKLVGKELNRALRDDDGDIYDIIAGDFLVVGLGEDDFCSLSPELMKQFEEHFHQPETFVRMGRSIMALAGLLFMILSGMFSSCSAMFQGGTQIILGTSFTAKEEDIIGADNDYKALEAALRNKINNIERTHSGYDEYRYDLDEINHNPYELAAYLTVKFEDYTRDEVQATLQWLFEQQYELTLTEVVEIRTRTTSSTDPETGETTTEEEDYEYYILNVKLRNKGLNSVISNSGLSEDDMERYRILLQTRGNRPDIFGNDIYATPGGEYTDYDIPGEALTDTRFANMIREAEKYLGYPYVWGGSSPSTSFDCSGFVSYVINHCGNGWSVGRLTANGLMGVCDIIPKSSAKPGDLIFFQGTYDTSGASHVGIYVGNGMMIHCGNPISYASIESNYWQQHFYCFGRIRN